MRVNPAADHHRFTFDLALGAALRTSSTASPLRRRRCVWRSAQLVSAETADASSPHRKRKRTPSSNASLCDLASRGRLCPKFSGSSFLSHVEPPHGEPQVTVLTKRGTVRAESEEANLYAAMDKVADKISSQLRKLKERENHGGVHSHHKACPRPHPAGLAAPAQAHAAGQPRVLKSLGSAALK